MQRILFSFPDIISYCVRLPFHPSIHPVYPSISTYTSSSAVPARGCLWPSGSLLYAYFHQPHATREDAADGNGDDEVALNGNGVEAKRLDPRSPRNKIWRELLSFNEADFYALNGFSSHPRLHLLRYYCWWCKHGKALDDEESPIRIFPVPPALYRFLP